MLRKFKKYIYFIIHLCNFDLNLFLLKNLLMNDENADYCDVFDVLH